MSKARAGEYTAKEMRGVLSRLILPWCSKNANEWAVRDTLLKFTRWGFWRGGEYMSIDEQTAKRIVASLKAELPNEPDAFVEEVWDVLHRYEGAARGAAKRR